MNYTVVIARHKESGQIVYRVYHVLEARDHNHARDVAREAYEASDEYIQYHHEDVVCFPGLHEDFSKPVHSVSIGYVDATPDR